ncbi:FAD-dependent oxidoreductase [Arcanobacterium ihumii]|uniref:FAD-dependent oxidoreductase n=1 Tax=Arcanobacterium ihumii TaxID=2138162 RepID=UPI000F54ACB8|nr:FAD-dependent oxidoreductase [Arcanobacterium ihumii]
MEEFDVVVIGWGKGGKTLAINLQKQGKKVAIVEQSSMMYGGTCINIGCVPTKTLVHQAEIQVTDKQGHFHDAVKVRDALISKLNSVNYSMFAEIPGATVFNGRARFITPKIIEIETAEGAVKVSGESVVINTGAVPVVPPIDGIPDEILQGKANIALPEGEENVANGSKIFTSTTIQHMTDLPDHLVVVGGGFIGLEFASMFANFGSKVTVFHMGEEILESEDPEVAQEVRNVLEQTGITFVTGARVKSVREAIVRADTRDGNVTVNADAVLLAVGRRPATSGLALDEVGIDVDERGAVVVNDYLETSVPGVFALGDVNGGPQHTYISLDDFRIVKDRILFRQDGSSNRSSNNCVQRSRLDRVAVPVTTFLTPPLSSVGLTAKDAQKAGYSIKVVTKKVASIKAMPRPKTVGDPRGLISIVVDANTDMILGARLFHVDSQEVINLVALAMRAKIPVSELRDGIWTHPSSTEALNEVLGELQLLEK